jgi:hypothetical protein
MHDICWGVLIFIALLLIIGWWITYSPQAKERQKEHAKRVAIMREHLVENQIKIDKTFALSNLQKEIKFDFSHKKMIILDLLNYSIRYVEFKEILDCEIIEDNSTIMKGGIGRAVVGSVLAGGVGAVVGVGSRRSTDIVRNLSVRIITRQVSDPMIMLTFINYEVERSGRIYKDKFQNANELYSTIVSIINSDNTTSPQTNRELAQEKTQNFTASEIYSQTATDNELQKARLRIISILNTRKNGTFSSADSTGSTYIYDQIREMGKLKDEGLITEEEFTNKKRDLLNLV